MEGFDVDTHAGLEIVSFLQSGTAENVQKWQYLLLAIPMKISFYSRMAVFFSCQRLILPLLMCLQMTSRSAQLILVYWIFI